MKKAQVEHGRIFQESKSEFCWRRTERELESDRKFLAPIFSNETIDKIMEIERADDHEISIRPHPHEFYLYFDI